MSWRRFFHRERADVDHAEEFRSHLEIDIEENISRGMPPDEARRAAHRKFGSPTLLREEVYTMNGIGFLEALARDLRYSARTLVRNPGFTATAILCLALGIGATTAIFSVVNAVLLRPLPYADSERLLRIYTASAKPDSLRSSKFGFSEPELFSLQKEGSFFQFVHAWFIGGTNVTGGQEPIRPTVAFVTGGLLESLGVAPIRGRLLTPADDHPGTPCAAVISYGIWQSAFAADPAVLGRDVLFSGTKCSVVGIMPQGFQFPPGEVDPPDMWRPLQLNPARPGSSFNHYLSLLGSLKPGVAMQRARGEMNALLARIEARGGENHLGLSIRLHRVAMFPFREEVIGDARPALLVLLGAVAFVLLIACVNVANLLLARAETRRREIAIRKAVGAGLSTLLRQFVAEGLLLSLAGATLGLGIAFAGIRFLTTSNAGNVPRVSEIGINWGVLVFTLALSIATGVAFGLAPVAQLMARNLHDTLKSATSRNTATAAATRFRHALVVSELALALVLLIGTGLMIQAFWKLQQVQIGLNPHNLLTMNTSLPGGVYPRGDRVLQFWTDLQQRVSALPRVASASMMSGLPPLRPVNSNTTPIEGYVPSPDRPAMNIDFFQTVGPRYFETMGVRLIEGRFFDERDGPGAPRAVIVNESLAQHVWPNQSALGHRVQPGGPPDWWTIVGVVEDVKNNGVDQPAGTELYLSYLQTGGGALRAGYLVVRTRSRPSGLIGAARDAIRSLDPSLPINKVREMDDVIASVQSRPRLLTVLLTMFACVALVLATIGIYGVISYSVTQRTNEFGIRIAMGASSSDVLRVVLRLGLVLWLAGLILGAIGAFWLTRFLAGVLFGISAVDPGTFAGMVLLLGAVTLLACCIPARRATKVDPMIALRYD
jgi:putative ABC transport system permease protein